MSLPSFNLSLPFHGSIDESLHDSAVQIQQADAKSICEPCKQKHYAENIALMRLAFRQLQESNPRL